ETRYLSGETVVAKTPRNLANAIATAAIVPVWTTRNNVQPYRNPIGEPNASRRKTYTPPARGIIVASSEQHSAPVIVSKPASAHASKSQPGAPLNRDDSAETMKMPDPIIEPMTIIVASSGPSARTRLVVSLGDGPPSGRRGPALRRGGAPAPLSRRSCSIRTSGGVSFLGTATLSRS